MNTVKGSVLAALQAKSPFNPVAFSNGTGVPIEQVLSALRKLRIEGRVTGSGRGLYDYVPGSIPVPSSRHDRNKAERVRRERAQRAAANAMPTLSLVRWAQINSPTSVWAYAARSAA